MGRWLLASSVVALAAAGQSRADDVNPMVKIVKLLKEMKNKIEADLEKQEKAYKKLDCAATKQIEANDKLIERNDDKIDVSKTEQDGLNSTTLTDESQNLSDQIAALTEEIEKAEASKKEAEDKYAMVDKDLEDGINALQAAKEALGASTDSGYKAEFLAAKAVMKRLGNSPLKHTTMLHNLVKATETPGKNLDTIKDMADTLLQEFQEERNDAKLANEQDMAARTAIISDLNGQKSNKEDEFNAGTGEAAAKEKRRKELQDIIDDANAENDDARAESEIMAGAKKEAKKQWNTFHADMLDQLKALKKAIQILIEKGRAKFQKVTGNDFLQVAMSTATRAQQTDAVKTLINAISDFQNELKQEKDDITSSIKDCDATAKDALTNGNQKAEQMDGHIAARDAAIAIVEAEQKLQEELTQEIKETDEEKQEKNKVFRETTKELAADAMDLDAASGIVQEAIDELNKYKPKEQADKTRFHKSDQGNPFQGVIGMLDNAKKTFDKDAANLRNEVDVLTTENTEMNTKVGTVSDKSETGQVTAFATRDSIIGNLENDRNVSIEAQTKAETDRDDNQNHYDNESKALYGDDGNGGIWGGIAKRQQQCDYWMINGPVRMDSIESETKALQEAKIVLENDKELGLAEGDEATLEARSKGADHHDHGDKDHRSVDGN